MGGSTTKMVKAKYAARVLAMHAGMGIPAFWNETIEFAFRPTSNGGLQGPYQPEPIYYVIRSLATAFDGIEPAEFKVTITPRSPEPAKVVDGAPYYAYPADEAAQPVTWYGYRLPDGRAMLAIWYDGFGDDDFEPITLDCQIEFEARSAEGIDIMNGVRQQLDGHFNSNTARLPNLKIPDYPLIVVLEGA